MCRSMTGVIRCVNCYLNQNFSVRIFIKKVRYVRSSTKQLREIYYVLIFIGLRLQKYTS